MNFKIMSSTSFHKIQRTYLISTVDEYWEKQQREVLSSFEGHKLIVMGDGRNDSPGHSAQYCSYTMMEYDSKKILTLRTLDKRSTDRKSTNMEKVGFEQAIQELTDNNIAVEEVVTDAHLGIGSIMKKKYPEIKHSHDIWHAAKNLGKRLGKIVKKKANQILIPWLKDIVNHFWFACSKADSYEEFLVCNICSIWRGVLHHITNKHEWIQSQGTGINGCLHDPLDKNEVREKPWLSTSDHARVLQDLSAVILDKRFLSKVSYYLNYRTTADIEVFHQLILMYCAKRFAYTPPVYRIRNLLAAIDHNYHSNRPLKTNKD
ncbi:uncharacterized protein LOC127852858 isoform X1 [Dreissena polymorpha]|uniref:uncharacterized protein LOC127852858 isoform X1 n=1 Tax=Dreissena polymorpha TaxID=45954 RepID=UPI002264D23C|nr:uncharacterized protein LOC127852858 isoform X1 [Dreissena polymorpha]